MAGTAIALTASGAGAAGRSSLQHAKLRIFESVKPPPRSTSGATAGSPMGELAFQFNPKEMSIQKAAKWERKRAPKATAAGPVEFTGSDPCKLSLELFFDATDTLDTRVVDAVEKLFSCTVPMNGDPDRWPPLVVLDWGSVTSFLGFVTSVQAKYTLFAPGGTPLRATCSVSIEEMPQTAARQNPTSGTQAVHSQHTLVEGESLASVAYREYGDPALWRPLAAFNGIDDPMRLRPGATLDVPELGELLVAGRERG
jgi:nucleoid-associated protein YgaU